MIKNFKRLIILSFVFLFSSLTVACGETKSNSNNILDYVWHESLTLKPFYQGKSGYQNYSNLLSNQITQQAILELFYEKNPLLAKNNISESALSISNTSDVLIVDQASAVFIHVKGYRTFFTSQVLLEANAQVIMNKVNLIASKQFSFEKANLPTPLTPGRFNLTQLFDQKISLLNLTLTQYDISKLAFAPVTFSQAEITAWPSAGKTIMVSCLNPSPSVIPPIRFNVKAT